MSPRWRLRDFLVIAGPLAVVLGVATLGALAALARRAVCR
jgi:hypothetical protein